MSQSEAVRQQARQEFETLAVERGWDDITEWRNEDGYDDVEYDAAWWAYQAGALSQRRKGTECGCCSTMLSELAEFTQCPAEEDVVVHTKTLLGEARMKGYEEAAKIADEMIEEIRKECRAADENDEVSTAMDLGDQIRGAMRAEAAIRKAMEEIKP